MGGNKSANIAASELLSWYEQEFRNALREPGARLMVIGYGFADTHINDDIRDGAAAGMKLRAGSGCLNNNSASISGASAGVRPPRGAEENRSRLDRGCGRQGSNAVVARCKSRDIDQSSFGPHRRFRRLADRPPRI